jgi:hypothetical protein
MSQPTLLWTYRQKTNFTTLGILCDGFSVSPAVIPKLSVPPSTKRIRSVSEVWNRVITSKTRRYKYSRESTPTPHKWRTGYVPVPQANILVFAIDANIHKNADNDEDNDGGNFY